MSICLPAGLFVCLHVYLSVCLYVCLCVYLFVGLSVSLFVGMFICVAVCVAVCLSVCSSVCLSFCATCASVCLSVFCLFVCLFVRLFVCLSTCLHFCLLLFISVHLRTRGHPFMTSTRRGRGDKLRWTHVDGGGVGSSPMWTSTQKIKIRVHLRHTVFFSCKEVGVFFLPEFRLWTEKKVEIFCDIN